MYQGVGTRRTVAVAVIAALGAAILIGAISLFAQAATAGGINEDCPADTTEYKVNANPLQGLDFGESAQFVVDGQTFTFTKVLGVDPFFNNTFDFTSTIPVTYIYVKSGTP